MLTKPIFDMHCRYTINHIVTVWYRFNTSVVRTTILFIDNRQIKRQLVKINYKTFLYISQLHETGISIHTIKYK